MNHNTDIDLETGDILELGSLDAIVSFFNKLGYDTGHRAPLTPEAIGLAGDSAKALKKVELISEDSEQFMRVVFAQSRSLTAKVRNDLARVLGKSTTDHVVVLTADFTTLEFVFLDKRRKQSKGPVGIQRIQGDTVLNVPTYNGGLFNTEPLCGRAPTEPPDATEGLLHVADRSDRISQFLLDHKIPDRQLALAIDRLSRDQDERTLALAFIDYKSLEVRHLGSIHEGLLEFKLKIATEDLTTETEKGKEKFISLTKVAARRRSRAEVVVKKNAVYLSNDNAERKASGSYYTPDRSHIRGLEERHRRATVHDQL